MKIAKFFAVIFAVLGLVLLVGCPIFFLANRNSSVKIMESPDKALVCSEELMNAVNAGDYAAVGQLLYGQPQLGGEGTPADGNTALVWSAFRSQMTFSYTSKLYLLDADLARDAVITVLDVPQVLELVRSETSAILERKVRAAEDPSTLYDATGSYRPEVVEQAMQEALQQVLGTNPPCVSYNVTIKLIRREDRWWAVPDQTFLKAISGQKA